MVFRRNGGVVHLSLTVCKRGGGGYRKLEHYRARGEGGSGEFYCEIAKILSLSSMVA